MEHTIKVIAHIHNDFTTKFGIPRQSGLTDLESIIVFEPEYQNADALRGIEGFSHLWLLWDFSLAHRKKWSPTVRPPRLGGNKRMGVFATRSPFRPNPIGLSSVKLLGVEKTHKGMVLRVSGADILSGTPIYDIKPYLPYTDSHPDAKGGFAEDRQKDFLKVEIENDLLNKIPKEKQAPLTEILSEDPRPHYIDNPNRIYGFEFSGFEVKFRVNGDTLYVTDIIKK
ncbi:MAG: tRNA (N6-threonylcarbamoyladenosine(37)-N6)-methyltransferase TrmO [Clostridia bacterium]|nr:tRNA (N6-threonylcarbamoyladenosine(37)-N6)-methyltransferase TrmO [Clostridia bacterium]